MRKIVTLLGAPAGEARADFQAWVMDELADRLTRAPGVSKLTVNLIQDPPAFQAPPPPNPAAPEPFDVVIMTWLDDAAAPPADLLACSRAGRFSSFAVDEIVEKAEIPITQGTVTLGIKNLPLILCQDQLDAQTRRDKWAQHGQLGLRLHTGMKRYVRNVVVEALTAGGPPVDGIGEVGFPSLDDLQFGLFPKPDDRAEFVADVAGWVKASTPQYAIEHVLKW